MHKNVSRKKFLTTGLLGLSALTLGATPLIKHAVASRVRVGLIGTGQRGLGLAGVIGKISRLELAACCDINEDHLRAGMKLSATGAKSYKNYKQLLEDKSIDAVIIATPLYLHYDMVINALAAGKHVYVEKTMCYDIPQAVSMAKKLKQHKQLILQVGHQYRYYDMYPKIKKMIADKMIGTVTHYEAQYNRNSDWRRPVGPGESEKAVNWRLYKEFSGGPLAELAAHQIDLVNWFEDTHPEKVVAMGGIDFWKDGRTTYDNIHALYEYPGGIKSSVISVLDNEFGGYRMRIYGSDGTLELGRDYALFYSERKVKTIGTVDGVTGATKEALKNGEGIYVYKDKRKTEPTHYALTGFADSIIDGNAVVSNVMTGKDTAIAVHLGNASAATSKTHFWKPEYTTI